MLSIWYHLVYQASWNSFFFKPWWKLKNSTLDMGRAFNPPAPPKQGLAYTTCGLLTPDNWRLACKKGENSILGRFLFFCRVELFFGRLTCFDMKSIVVKLFLLICPSFLRNCLCKKPQFSEQHLLERILRRWILMWRKLKWFLLAASTAQFF